MSTHYIRSCVCPICRDRKSVSSVVPIANKIPILTYSSRWFLNSPASLIHLLSLVSRKYSNHSLSPFPTCQDPHTITIAPCGVLLRETRFWGLCCQLVYYLPELIQSVWPAQPVSRGALNSEQQEARVGLVAHCTINSTPVQRRSCSRSDRFPVDRSH